MNCEEVQNILSLYLTKDLKREESDEVDRHLAVCPACREEAEDLHAMIQGVREARLEDPGDLFFQRQLRQIENKIEAESSPSRSQRALWRWVPVAAAAAIAVLIFGLAQMDRQRMSMTTFDAATLLQFFIEENEFDPGLADWEELNSQQLELLANNLEKKILLEDGERWDEDGLDWEDLSGPQLDRLIQALKEGSGRPT